MKYDPASTRQARKVIVTNTAYRMVNVNMYSTWKDHNMHTFVLTAFYTMLEYSGKYLVNLYKNGGFSAAGKQAFEAMLAMGND